MRLAECLYDTKKKSDIIRMDFRKLDDYKNDRDKRRVVVASSSGDEKFGELREKLEAVKEAQGSPESVKVFVQCLTSISEFPAYVVEKSDLVGVLMKTVNTPVTRNMGLAAVRHLALNSKAFVHLFVCQDPSGFVKSVLNDTHFEARFLGLHIVRALAKEREGSEWIAKAGILAVVLSQAKGFTESGLNSDQAIASFAVAFKVIKSVVYHSQLAPEMISDVFSVLEFCMKCPQTPKARFKVAAVLTCFLKDGREELVLEQRTLVTGVVNLLLVKDNVNCYKLVIQFLAQLMLKDEVLDRVLELETPDVVRRCLELFCQHTENEDFCEVCIDLFVNHCVMGSEALEVFIQYPGFIDTLVGFIDSSAHLQEAAIWLMWTMLYVATVPQTEILLPRFMPFLGDSFLIEKERFMKHVLHAVDVIMRRITTRSLWDKPIYKEFISTVMTNTGDLQTSQFPEVARLASRIATTYPKSMFVK